MDLLDPSLRDLIQEIDDCRVRGLFSGLRPGPTPTVGARTFIAGEVLDYGDEWVDLRALWFTPAAGFVESTDDLMVRVSFHEPRNRCLHLCKGIDIVCSGERVEPSSSIIKLDKAHICFKPEVSSLPWDVAHLFCGAFCGWHHGLKWLDSEAKAICVGQELFIDHDSEVMTIWQAKYATPVRTLPLTSGRSWSHGKFVGLCGEVGEPSIIEACRTQANLMVTMSPPCQSWSKGGLKAGLSDSNGKAFLDALELAFSLQAIVISAECADDVVAHPHFRLVKAFAHVLGYRLVWDQVTPYNSMVSHARTRWLGVWTRADIQGQAFPFVLKLPMIPRSHWTDQAYQFRLPSMCVSQLLLSPSECQIYDSVEFLPPAKRARFENNLNKTNEIIRSRIPRGSEVLPTLCASYTRQHELARHHLAQKGIFACLQEHASGFSFFDPAMFSCLFGATEHVVLSEKVSESFHFIGNAITVPHSVLTLCIALHAVSECRIDPIGLVRNAWFSRLTTHNSILFAHEGLVHLIPTGDFWNWISIRKEQPIDSDRAWILFGTCANRYFECHAKSKQTLMQVFGEHFCGPTSILEQIYGRADDFHSDNRTLVEQFAGQEPSLRLMAGLATLGNCEIRAYSQFAHTKVIDDSLKLAGALDIVVPPRLDLQYHSGLEVFWMIQEIVETLQDDSSAKNFAANIVVQPEEVNITVFLTKENCQHLLGQVSQLSIFQGRNKHFARIPGEATLSLFIFEAKDCDKAPYAEAVVRLHNMPLGGIQIPINKPDVQFRLQESSNPLKIYEINGLPACNSSNSIKDGDIIDLCFAAPTRAGGHHLNLVAPPSLPAMSDFTARVEFLCDTHGWVATDEMFHYTQALQWQQNWLRFGTPQLWNVANGDFEDPIFGELNIVNNATTAIPVLIGSHWAGIEVSRQGVETQVTFIQVPVQLHTPLTFLVARLLDIAPHRFHVNYEYNDPPPHICGWNLIYRWYRRHGIHQGVADISNHMTLNQEYNELIQLAMQCSSEDWARAQMPFDIGHLAYTLRKNFLCFLARREFQGRPHQQIALDTACPPLRPQAQNPPDPPLPAVTPLPWLDRTQLVRDRIQDRLYQILQHPDWLSSDELDIALEGPRAMNPQTLFCPPSSWSLGASHLHFFNDYTPDYRAYNQVIWIIEVNRHWVQAEAYLHEDSSNFAFTFPVDSHIQLQPLVDHLLNVTGARETQISIHFYDQNSPRGMCGYQLLAHIYQRLAANTVPLQPPQRRQLSFHALAADLYRAQHEALALWNEAGAHPFLVEFASNIRQWFLVRVSENRFPPDTVSGGGKDQEDVTMKPAGAAAPSDAVKTTTSTSVRDKDPWLKSDPWLKAVPRPAQCKWEDLLLKDPIPFTGTDGSVLPQNHRLQIGGARGGIVLATKTHIQDIAKAAGSNDLAILLPASDNLIQSASIGKVQGPFEISVDDTAAKISYKRLVMMYVIRGTISFKLPAPIAKLTIGAVCEIVLEIDGRLVPKADIDRFRENPIASFKALLGEVVPKLDSSAVIFGYRIASPWRQQARSLASMYPESTSCCSHSDHGGQRVYSSVDKRFPGERS